MRPINHNPRCLRAGGPAAGRTRVGAMHIATISLGARMGMVVVMVVVVVVVVVKMVEPREREYLFGGSAAFWIFAQQHTKHLADCKSCKSRCTYACVLVKEGKRGR